jgi:hypothetical protein
MSGAIPPLPQYAFMAWCLVKHRDNFILKHLLLSSYIKARGDVSHPCKTTDRTIALYTVIFSVFTHTHEGVSKSFLTGSIMKYMLTK